MNLSQIDLNLLVILKQLLEEQHVTNTALTLNMSQPTVSRALNKSRQLFSDPLLVRSNTGYSLTPKAESIKKDLNSVLSRLENLVEGDSFDPKTSSKTIRLFGLAPQIDLFIPLFIEMMRQEAPNMVIEIDTVSKPHFLGLISGEHHFVFSHQDPSTGEQDIYRQNLTERDFRLLMSAKHPLASEPLSAEILRNCHFGQVSLQGDKKLSIEPRFRELGMTGDNGQISTPVRLNNFSAAAGIAERSDIIFHLPTAYALNAARSHDLVCREVPEELRHPSKSIYLYWHKRYHQDPMSIWVRNKLSQIQFE